MTYATHLYVWELPSGELVLVDYKAKATDKEITLEPKRKKNGDIVKTDRYLISYRRQIEFYQWLFRKNGFQVANTAYFVFANAQKTQANFDNQLIFEKVLLPYQGDGSWIEPILFEIRKCLESNVLPQASAPCDFCSYHAAVRKHLGDHE